MKKVLALVTAIIAVLGALSLSKAQDTKFDWKQAAGAQLTVSLNQHPYSEMIVKRLEEFKKLTGIDVKYEITPEENYFDKITTQLSSNSGNPDVFMVGVYQMWDYASSKRLESLDKYLNDARATSPDYKPDDILPGVFQAGKWNLQPGSKPGTGDLWALPLGFEMYALAYNKRYFDEKNLTPPKTLAELHDLAVKLKGWNGPGSYGVAMRGTRNWATIHPGYMSVFTNAGAKDFVIKDGKLLSALDEAEAIEITKLYAQIIKDGGPPGWSNYTWYQCSADLGAGKAAMSLDADCTSYFVNFPGASKESGNIAFAPIPALKEGDALGSNEWVWELAMNANSKNKKAAWLFIQYFTSSEHATWAAVHDRLMDPARKSVWNNPDFQKKLAGVYGYRDTFQKQIDDTGIKFTPQPYFIESTTEWAAALQKIVLSGADPEKTMKNLAKQISRNTSKLKLESSSN